MPLIGLWTWDQYKRWLYWGHLDAPFSPSNSETENKCVSMSSVVIVQVCYQMIFFLPIGTNIKMPKPQKPVWQQLSKDTAVLFRMSLSSLSHRMQTVSHSHRCVFKAPQPLGTFEHHAFVHTTVLLLLILHVIVLVLLVQERDFHEGGDVSQSIVRIGFSRGSGAWSDRLFLRCCVKPFGGVVLPTSGVWSASRDGSSVSRVSGNGTLTSLAVPALQQQDSLGGERQREPDLLLTSIPGLRRGALFELLRLRPGLTWAGSRETFQQSVSALCMDFCSWRLFGVWDKHPGLAFLTQLLEVGRQTLLDRAGFVVSLDICLGWGSWGWTVADMSLLPRESRHRAGNWGRWDERHFGHKQDGSLGLHWEKQEVLLHLQTCNWSGAGHRCLIPATGGWSMAMLLLQLTCSRLRRSEI